MTTGGCKSTSAALPPTMQTFCGSTCLIDVQTMHQCHKHCHQQCGPGYTRMRSKDSDATVQTDVFRENEVIVPGKFVKIVGIFDKIDGSENRGVIQ